MPSLIHGFEYDIFISYRQKDNKHDGWVTEFVNNLKGELESTFKEEVSVYFDINPHDGLLETHDVDASLKDKLKCLVFIPIISRTYCDPKSFAWEHEFKAFIDQASKDKYGLKVKLPGGNVANRVLPVQIHDLDTEDKKLVESELGGFLRGIEFIYKEPGVNRSLMANEDHPDNNLNKTFYRNQINKVANAIKEIITAIKQYSTPHEVVQKGAFKTASASGKTSKTKVIAGSITVLALIILGFLFVPKLFKSSEEIEKSIAVLPFNLLSDEPDKQYLADGMMDAITLHLSKIKDLRVMGRTSTEQYRNPTKTLTAIGKELEVSYLLEGSFQKFGDSVRLIVQLIKTGKEGHVWANNYDRLWKSVFSVQSEVAQSIARELKAAVTPEEKVLIDKIPTTNLTAYDFYQRGKEEYINFYFNNTNRDALKRTIELFKKALEYDSTFALAYSGLAVASKDAGTINDYLSQNYFDSIPILAKKALYYDDKIAEAYYARALYFYITGKSEQAKEEFDKAIKYNPNYWEAYADKAGFVYLDDYSNTDFVKAIEYYAKAINLNQGKERPDLLRRLGDTYDNAGFADKAVYCYQEAFKLDNDSLLYFSGLGGVEWCATNFNKAAEHYNRVLLIDTADINNQSDLGSTYMHLGRYKESLKYFEKYFEWVKASGTINEALYHRIGFVYWKTGHKDKAKYYLEEGKRVGEESIKLRRAYASMSLGAYYDLAGIYAFMGEKDKAYKNLEELKKIKVFPLWWLTLIKNDPLFDSIKDEPQFREIVNSLESKYLAEHERVRKWLEEQGEL
ncbi:MAG: hypothetical protein A2V64_01965 [Bacteroidetes bacterium RBG_13_43_22]|nr:MAG: hypothetical protein A2V64_01965 [Bacteroidetes bacterium RBG_13_43_22]